MTAPKPFVIVSGVSASGKTCLARPLAATLGLPLLSLDTIRESLADALCLDGTSSEHTLWDASLRVLVALAGESQGAVVDAYWRPSATWALRTFEPGVVEVLCTCPAALLGARIDARRESRHRIHRDRLGRAFVDETLADARVFQPVTRGPVLQVDTSSAIDMATLARAVTRALAGDNVSVRR
jgi:glucokinase